MLPPVIGKRTWRPAASAGPVGETFTPRSARAAAVPLARVSRVWPSARSTAAWAAGAEARAAAVAATRMMLRFTGEPPVRG